MTVHDLTDALADTAALLDIARRAGVTLEQARTVAAALSDLPMVQTIRICSTAQSDRIRQANRQTRKGARR